MEAPVTTTTFPESSIARFYSSIMPKSIAPISAASAQSRPWRTIRTFTPLDIFLELLIPLFPLDVVLFPGAPLPLHIFEPRYKEMIGECLAQHLHFGVIRAAEKGLADVGCTAEIVTVVKEYP